jgi:hypothetical protein
MKGAGGNDLNDFGEVQTMEITVERFNIRARRNCRIVLVRGHYTRNVS